GRVTRYMRQAGGVPYSSFLEDREGNIWLTTDGQGLYRLRSQTIQVNSTEQGLPDRNVYPVYQTKDGAIWVGTWSGGLGRFRDGKVATYTTTNGLASNRVLSIGEDPDGILWVSVERGLHRLRNGHFERVVIPGVSDCDVRVIHPDPRGVLWLGCSAGLVRFEHREWALLTRKDGLASDDVRVIIDGHDGSLW